MKKNIFFLMMVLISTGMMAAPLSVVTVTQEQALLVQKMGGREVKTECLTLYNQDLHQVQARPSMIIKLKKADLLVRVGMRLDDWLDALILNASKASFFDQGVLDLSKGITKLQVPNQPLDGRLGDIHPEGNPHYWLDPYHLLVMAKQVSERLALLRPEKASYFAEQYQIFEKEWQIQLKKWDQQMAPLKGAYILTYHDSLPYFAKRYQLVILGQIEIKPGIPPTPAHLLHLKTVMKAKPVKAIFVEPYYPKEHALTLQQPAKTIVFSTSIAPNASLESLYEQLITPLVKASY